MNISNLYLEDKVIEPPKLYENDKVSEYSKIEEFNNDNEINEVFITTLESSEEFTESEETDSNTITEEDYVLL